MRKIIGIGETILDVIFKGNQPSHASPGGSTFNAMVSLARAKQQTAFISEIGADTVGELILNFMRENEMDTQYMDTFDNGKSPISLAFLNEQNDAKYQFYTQYPAKRLDIIYPVITAQDFVLFGSYFAVNPLLREQVSRLIIEAELRGAIIFYDINFRDAHAHEAIKLTPTFMDNMEYATIIRGSKEDFINLYKNGNSAEIYQQKMRFYTPAFLFTDAEKGVDLYTPQGKKHYDVPVITPVSTIGAGDNFNAGILYALAQTKITKADLATLPITQWDNIIATAISFATEVCHSYDNFISKKFASQL